MVLALARLLPLVSPPHPDLEPLPSLFVAPPVAQGKADERELTTTAFRGVIPFG